MTTTFTNQATLSYGDTVTSSNVTSERILAAISATKTPIGDEYNVDGSVTYVISIVNDGAMDLNNLTLCDNLGREEGEENAPLAYIEGTLLYYINGEIQPEPEIEAGPPLAVNGIDVPKGGNATIIYSAAVTPFASPEAGGEINNKAVIKGCRLTAPITACATVTATEEAELNIAKSMCPTTVTENAELTYTFIIQNSGNTAAGEEENAIITDTFDPILNDLTVTIDGEEQTEGEGYSYNEATGEFATADGALNVPATDFEQQENGIWTVTPGVTVVTVTGTV